MKVTKIACKLLVIGLVFLIMSPTIVFANLTKEQSEDVALFATTFIEKGNRRRDENGYPLLVYALSNNWQTCIEIRRSGYYEELYHIKNNNYHMKNGKYLDLGLKWCMDCGDYISYVYKTTLGLDLYLHDTEDPWHIRDMYSDAKKGQNSKYFEFIYKDVPISKIDETLLEKGDIVLRMGSRENHGLIYVGEGMQTAHASRNAIKYAKNPSILGFEVVQLNRFYKNSTVVSIVRVKNGVVPIEQKVNSTITWPDTGEREDLLNNDEILKRALIEEEMQTKLENELEVLVKRLNQENNLQIAQMIDDKEVETFIVEMESTKQVIIEKDVYNWLIEEVRKILLMMDKISNK